MTETAPCCFVLRADGHVHASDVRHVSSNAGRIATASRDHTATVRSAVPHGDDVPAGCTLVGHTAFVNFALLYAAAPLLEGNTAVVTGSNDGHIALWDAETGKLEAVLSSHTQGVCCGTITASKGNNMDSTSNNNNNNNNSNDAIVTGDWGGVCLVFDGTTGRVRQSYTAHKTAVRGITALPGTTNIVSVSGDTTVHRWDVETGKTLAIYTAHKDAVQCVCALSSTRFASAGNDATIMVWDTAMGTTPMCVLAAHDSSIYGLCYCTERRLLFSAAEDHTVKVWCGGVVDISTSPQSLANTDAAAAAVVQSISHPCVVWSVCLTETGDIVTGGSDGILRIWTTNEDHMASVEKLQALEEAIAAQKFDVKVVGLPPNMDTSSLPWVDELPQRKGTVEGERLLVRSDAGSIEVYTWNSGRWDKLGTVVSGPDGTNYTGAGQSKPKVYHNGVPHDYVFDVDVNGKMLKLTYDKGQSVFDAAQNFIDSNSHVVSQTHKEEIQNFILNNVDPQDIQSGDGNPALASAAAAGGAQDSGEPLFSEFAREAAAMRQAGSTHTPSWSEALRNLESAGVPTDAVAFSGYAREQMELEKQRAAAAANPAVGSSENEQPNIAVWDGFRFFTTFNANGAQTKINELTGDAQFNKLVEEVLTAAKSEPNVAIMNAIIALYHKLPESSRFPAIDLLSYLLAIASHPFEWVMLLLGNGDSQSTAREFMQERVANIRTAPDAETLVTLRLFAHMVAALGKAPTTAILTFDQRELLLTALTKAPQPFLRTTKKNIKTGISAVVRNTAVCLSRHSAVLGDDGASEFTSALVRLVAQWLIFEPSDSPYTRDLVSTILTLVQTNNNSSSSSSSDSSSVNTITAVAVEVGRSTLAHTMRVLKECAEPQCREAATNILNIFNEAESH
ncbi:uncharacterized protein TM35_000152680 [Trypanosoma theileri]|uniref:Uncharacterized protein n=1 Tax=Trypanosoma theileri TaxID=67003 RepID=A0A1X0NVW7_9TRYP|nr:uncharacterized protein TM35_000152680 [Trypanosoma theileri]ORC88837.1 hypothetical protein TM35_000152680 [Trypanosoma theileri]